MKRKPKVTVIIPAFNAAKYIDIALESVLNQTFQDFEVIIVNDGSVDNTEEISYKYVHAYSDKFNYFYQENKGLAVARNMGINNTQSEYLALLDADDKWLPTRLEEGVKALDQDSSLGLVHGNITTIDENGLEMSTPKRDISYLSGFIFEHIFLRKADIACPTVLFRRSCCEDVGCFDENLTRLGCEDRDLWLRIAQKYKIAYIDKVLSYYRVSSSSMSANLAKMLEARLYVIEKYCPVDNKSKTNIRNKALAKVFRDRGDAFLLKNDYINARQEYIKSIKFYPLDHWAWINFIKAILK